MPYNPDEIRTSNMPSLRSSDVHFDPKIEPSMTQQSSLDECDINNIVHQAETTGFINHTNKMTPQWGDFGDSTDFQASLNYIQEATDAFMELPAEVRARFQNNPGALLDFIQDPRNQDEAIKLGLATRLPENEPEALPEASKSKKTSKQPDATASD